MLLLASSLYAKPPEVPLWDLRPGYVKADGRIVRNRTQGKPGVWVGGKRYRGITVPSTSRVGYDLDGCFATLRIKVGVLDATAGPIRFFVHGRGRVLAATPPMLAGDSPKELIVPLEGVLLLELEARSKRGGRAAYIDGVLVGAADKDLGRYFAADAPFNPRDYPSAFRRRVNTGIDRAVKFVRIKLAQRTPVVGEGALATLALLKAGVPATDPLVQKMFASFVRWKPDHVYSASVMLMALEAKYFPGGHLDRTDRAREADKVISKEDRARIAELANYLVQTQGAGFRPEQRKLNPVWRYPAHGYDLSCTQYAMLGLTSAARCGEPRAQVWVKAMRFLLGAQAEKGPTVTVSRYYRSGDQVRRRSETAMARGFQYQLSGARSGSMTSAGLCALALAHNAAARQGKYTDALRARTRRGIRDALAWLEEYYDLNENPFGHHRWWTYYLFNIERAGVLLDQRYIGTHDWYHEGSQLLLAAQGENGAVKNALVDTSFALLFWKRATVAARTSPLK